MNFTTRQPLHTSSSGMEDDLDSHPRSVLVPAYSMPGAADDEITFDSWRKQQQQSKDIVPPTQQVYSIPSLPHYRHQPCLRESQSHGESTPSGCTETRSDVHTEDLVSSESPVARPHVQQAWGSQTHLLDGQTEGDCTSIHTPSRVPSSRATQIRQTQRKEKIVSDW